MNFWAILVLLLLLRQPLFACLWTHGMTFDGAATSPTVPEQRLRQAMSLSPGERAAEQRFRASETETERKEAEAVNKAFAGDLRGALSMLTQIEERLPGRYSTAANLGTIYELTGDNVNALKWIREGINRNPESHDGTEWLHALILEAKVDAQSHPDRPLMKHLLDLPEILGPETRIVVHGDSYTAAEVQRALFRQLSERMIFVKPKDYYVADLLYSYSVIVAKMGSARSGLGLLKLSREYGFPDEPLLARQQKHYEGTLLLAELKRFLVVFACVLVPLLLLGYCYRRNWFFLSSRAYDAHVAEVARKKREARRVQPLSE